MSCDIGLGRAVKCKDQVGGLSAVYLINYDDVTGYTFTDDVIDTVTGAATINAYKYELKGTSS